MCVVVVSRRRGLTRAAAEQDRVRANGVTVRRAGLVLSFGLTPAPRMGLCVSLTLTV